MTLFAIDLLSKNLAQGSDPKASPNINISNRGVHEQSAMSICESSTARIQFAYGDTNGSTVAEVSYVLHAGFARRVAISMQVPALYKDMMEHCRRSDWAEMG